jgi:serine/threonine protein kinase
VKPANVLMDEGGTAKLADFGIARAGRPGGGEDTVTAMVTGTPSYLAPERAAGAPATVASDLWAVEVVLYEATTGVRPFQGATPFAVTLAARSGDTTPLRERRPDVDPVLAGVVHRALSPHPEDRFPSAAAMAAALEQQGECDPFPVPAAAGTSTLALASVPTPAAELSRARRSAARVWARLAVASAAGVLAVVLAWTMIGRAPPRRSHRPDHVSHPGPNHVPHPGPNHVPHPGPDPGSHGSGPDQRSGPEQPICRRLRTSDCRLGNDHPSGPAPGPYRRRWRPQQGPQQGPRKHPR